VRPGDRLLVAVSGGADSVALGHLLKTLPFNITLAHVDHGLRSSSAADARFVTRLARAWDVPVAQERVAVRAHAKQHRLGIEETARALRYEALTRMARRKKCVAIVTAHHADDQAETVLFNLLRGAGPQGLSGMAPTRELGGGLVLLRPLLGVRRAALRAYVRQQALPFREDPSNKNVAFTRNRLRRKTLPWLARDFPGLSERLVQMAEIFREEERFWKRCIPEKWREAARRKARRVSVDLRDLLGYHKALGRRILRSLQPGLSYQDLMRLMALAEVPNRTARLALEGGFLAFRKGHLLVITGPQRRRASQRNL
jgi:tRNA(Ile)-lysidine synthase